jgi:hypothetical protein
MSCRPRAPLTHPCDYTDEIENLRQEVVALTQRWRGATPLPLFLAEAVEELQAINAALTQTQQAVIREQLRYQELFEFAPDGYLVTDLTGISRRPTGPRPPCSISRSTGWRVNRWRS